MALTLLNQLYWQIPEAKVPFMIADVAIIVSMRYVEKGIKAENKLRKIEEQHAETKEKLDKGEKLGRKRELKQQQIRQRHTEKAGSCGGNGNNGTSKKLGSKLQQPSKH
mmetsp:Transcript_11972/g.28402  ORF Transcript_11972/g.28402 Transcript_11972/m.28402 type:complete len:109 (-) Transcript_11972:182-508(-)|eukprot:CAMPEP_0197188828 /NCGR_PEP_ID=MMETSP1423-20130617/18596_1 /TAXON_ID=476441 /ORGANISM="Pseudo-nitzschia heimii, Strain UNC1101" /LENGTH=108 /DNA_ID=CAMNT_0042640783 /DNA_START=56 /DNA_END=382 /DNA_ORIENTATION=+